MINIRKYRQTCAADFYEQVYPTSIEDILLRWISPMRTKRCPSIELSYVQRLMQRCVIWTMTIKHSRSSVLPLSH